MKREVEEIINLCRSRGVQVTYREAQKYLAAREALARGDDDAADRIVKTFQEKLRVTAANNAPKSSPFLRFLTRDPVEDKTAHLRKNPHCVLIETPEQFLERTGLSRDEVLAMSLDELEPHALPDDVARARQAEIKRRSRELLGCAALASQLRGRGIEPWDFMRRGPDQPDNPNRREGVDGFLARTGLSAERVRRMSKEELARYA